MTNREKEIYRLISENPMISQEELAEKAGISRSSVAVHISNLMKKGYIIGKGYIMQQPSYIMVIGAANMDIGGTPHEKLIGKDSNPGHVTTSLGGVGRNIAHNLSLLGNSVKFLTAFGDDHYAKMIMESCKELGIDTHDSFVSAKESTSTYLYITREDGDMELAVSDMEIYKNLTPEYLQSKESVLSHSSLIILDANLPEETISYVAKNSKVPIFAETVSCTKSKKFKNVLSYIHTITPNLLEAEILTDLSIDPNSKESLQRAADQLLRQGVKQVVITLGAKGCFYADGEVSELIPPIPADMVNGNGAGDALLSGLATGFSKGLSFAESVALGMASASITLETTETNNRALSYENAIKRAGIKGEVA